MPKFSLNDYTGVNDRMRLAADTWQSIVVSPPVMLNDIAGYVTATVTLKDGRSVTEIAAFRFGLSGASAQATFPIEDAATSAVGRALGRFGFGTDTNFPSREEMEHVERVQQQPPPPPRPAQTAEQRERITTLRELRQQLTSIGGTVTALTSSQVAAMPLAELDSLIAQTRADLEAEQQALANEAAQRSIHEA